jgi:hypothetical protein
MRDASLIRANLGLVTIHEIQAPECALNLVENSFERAIDPHVERQQKARLDCIRNRHHEGP